MNPKDHKLMLIFMLFVVVFQLISAALLFIKQKPEIIIQDYNQYPSEEKLDQEIIWLDQNLSIKPVLPLDTDVEYSDPDAPRHVPLDSFDFPIHKVPAEKDGDNDKGYREGDVNIAIRVDPNPRHRPEPDFDYWDWLNYFLNPPGQIEHLFGLFML